MKVYYIPFEVKTYVPVTIENIGNRAFYVFQITTESDQAKNLIKILDENDAGTFNSKMVRLKVQLQGKTYFVDSNGNVQKAMKISKANLVALKNSLNKIITEYKIERIK